LRHTDFDQKKASAGSRVISNRFFGRTTSRPRKLWRISMYFDTDSCLRMPESGREVMEENQAEKVGYPYEKKSVLEHSVCFTVDADSDFHIGNIGLIS
jgi:hypothetical protein